MRSGNPALNDKVFSRGLAGSNAMTISGTVQKTALLLLLVMTSGAWSWSQAFPGGWSSGAIPQIPFWYFPAIIVAFILSLVIIFKQKTAPYLAPVYSVLEGLALGAISALFEMRYPGIVSQAVFLTFGVLAALLLAYQSGLIKATENFKLGVVAATGGIAILYLISFVMGFFGSSIPVIHSNSTWGILFSLFVVAIAALNLVLDFDFIERGAERGAPKYMEWYAAFGLLITLVWLYLEILRLLSKANSRR